MEEIGETLALLWSTSTMNATIDEIQTIVQQSAAKAMANQSVLDSKKLALEEKHAILRCLSCALLGHEDKIKRVLHDLNNEALKVEDELVELELPDIPPHVLIHFVDVMDQANQYFDFKELAKLECIDVKPTTRRSGIYDILLHNSELISSLSKIGEPQIAQAANAIFWELIHEQSGNKDTKPKKDPALLDLIYNLVYRTRVKGYVMDQDPIAQLKKMMKSKPFLYEKYFLSQKLPVECTERLTQEARNKYSHLVSIMMDKYKKTSSEKASTTTSVSTAPEKRKRLMLCHHCVAEA